MAIAVREPLATLGTADVHRLTCLGNRRISDKSLLNKSGSKQCHSTGKKRRVLLSANDTSDVENVDPGRTPSRHKRTKSSKITHNAKLQTIDMHVSPPSAMLAATKLSFTKAHTSTSPITSLHRPVDNANISMNRLSPIVTRSTMQSTHTDQRLASPRSSHSAHVLRSTSLLSPSPRRLLNVTTSPIGSVLSRSGSRSTRLGSSSRSMPSSWQFDIHEDSIDTLSTLDLQTPITLFTDNEHEPSRDGPGKENIAPPTTIGHAPVEEPMINIALISTVDPTPLSRSSRPCVRSPENGQRSPKKLTSRKSATRQPLSDLPAEEYAAVEALTGAGQSPKKVATTSNSRIKDDIAAVDFVIYEDK